MTDKVFLHLDAQSDLPSQVFTVQAPGVDIGRNAENDLPLAVESVSRRHARLEHQPDGSWMIQDLKSSNGTFVNGEKIASSRLLNDGDEIILGKIALTFHTDHPDSGDNAAHNESSGIRIAAEEEDSSVILSTRLSDRTPFKTGAVSKSAEARIDRLTQRLMALYHLSDVLRGATRRDQILTALMDLVFENLPADRGVVLSVTEETQDLKPEMFRYREGADSREFILSRTIARRALAERVAVLSRDVRMDTRFNASESIMASDIRSAMCVPLAGKQHLLGLLFLDTREAVHTFTEDDLAFVSALATDAAMTLENLALMEENILQERLAAVGQTISGLAHNIKNILQLSRGGIELMELAIQKNNFDDIKTLWPITRRSIDRMQALTQEMLDFSRQSKPELAPGDVNKLICQLAEMIKADDRAGKITLKVECDQACKQPYIDEGGLSKALMNLLSNSFDALQKTDNANIVIGTLNQQTCVIIRVKDNGPGIPAEVLPKIFQPFYSTKGSKGNGLGLSMTRKYIEDMNGRLNVNSKPGSGCEFTITLPVDPPKT